MTEYSALYKIVDHFIPYFHTYTLTYLLTHLLIIGIPFDNRIRATSKMALKNALFARGYIFGNIFQNMYEVVNGFQRQRKLR